MSFEIVEEAQRRNSSLGSLVMAVLVGLLSLGANEYARVDRNQLDSYFSHWTLLTSFTSSDSDAEAASAPLESQVVSLDHQLRDLRSQLERLEFELGEAFEIWHRSGTKPPESLAQLLPKLTPATIDANATLREFTEEDRIALMRVLFIAAQIEPVSFADSFRRLNREVIKTESESVAASAVVLRIYDGIDFRTADRKTILGAIAGFDHRYPTRQDEGVELCSMVSDRLWRSNRPNLAEQVLRYGIKHYAGRSGVSRLVNQLIDQQRR